MCTEIKQTHPNELSINGKRVYKSAEGKWVLSEQLTPEESEAFRMHVKDLHKPIDINKQRDYWQEQSNYLEP